MKASSGRGAPEYCDACAETRRYAAPGESAWKLRDELARTLAALPPARLLHLACSACDATASLPGEVTGRGADERAPATRFDGHLEPGEGERFLAGAHRVAPDPVVHESAQRADVEPDERQERIRDDGLRASPP